MMNRQCSQWGNLQPYDDLMPLAWNGNGGWNGYRCQEAWNGCQYQDGWDDCQDQCGWNGLWPVRSMTDLADLVCGCRPPYPTPPHPDCRPRPCPCPGPGRVPVTLYKVNEQGTPLSGAVFRLQQYEGFDLLTEATNAEGWASAQLIPNCYYILSEIQAPPGYLPVSETHYIYVTTNGVVYVDGVITERPTFVNTAETQPVSVIFRKQNQVAQPLPGALFTLLGEGTFRTSYSDSNGFVTFDAVYPGTYTMVETAPPPGYMPNTTQYTVVVTAGGVVTIDGVEGQNFTVTDFPMI